MLTLFPSGLGALGCWHIPEGCTGLVPKDGLLWGWRSWGGRASQWALPHGPGEPAPLYTGPQPPDPSRSSCSGTTPTAPKGCGGSELEELWKAPWAPCLLVLGFPPPASFLRVIPPMDESTLPRVVLQQLGCVQGTGVRKEEGMGHKPWVFVLAHSTLTIQEQCFPQGSGSPSNQSWA